MGQRKSSGGASFSAAVLAGTLVALCSAPARAQARMPTHVACVGDSITMGVGASSNATNYPTRLQVLLGPGTVVRNFGHSGATLLTTGDLPYQRQNEYTTATDFVANAGADAVVDVIIMLGTNDSKPRNWLAGDAGTRAQQYATDCAALVDHFTSLPTHPVVYLALPLDALANTFTISGSVIRDEIIPVINQVAADKGMPTIDLNTPTAGHTEYFVDGVHPNDGGYVVVAGIMRDGILRVPQVTVVSPVADATVAGPAVSVTAEALAGTVAMASIEMFANDTSIGTVTQAPFTVAWSGAAPGAYALTAKATDATGAAATSSPVAITVTTGAGGGGGSAAGGDGSSGCGCHLDVAGDGVAASLAGLAVVALVLQARRRRQPLK